MTPDERPWSRWGDLVFPGIIVMCTALAMVSRPLAVNEDNALIMHYAQRLLDGETPYVDFFEINPPLIIYLSAVPVWLGKLLGQNPIIVFNGLVLAMVVWSGLSIRRTMIELDLPGRGVVLTAWACLAWSTQFSLTLGQREHLFLLGYVPFLLIRVARWCERPVARRRAIALGAVGGLMVAIKPQFFVIALIPEIYWAVRYRTVRPLAKPEVVSGLVVGCAYLLHFAVFPTIGRAYVLDLLPKLGSIYASFDDPWEQVADPTRFGCVVLAICVALLGPRPVKREPHSEAISGLTAFTIACFLIVYLLPQKVWAYHWEPAFHGSVLVLAFAVARSGLLSGPPRRLAIAAIGIATLGFALSTQVSPGMAEGQRLPKIRRAIADNSAPDEHVMMMACGVRPTWPLLMSLGRRQASFYSGLIAILPRFYPRDQRFEGYHSRDQMSAGEREFLDVLAGVERRYKPSLVVVHRACYGSPKGFDLWTYLREVGFVDEVLADFEQVGEVEDVNMKIRGRLVFVVLKRRR